MTALILDDERIPAELLQDLISEHCSDFERVGVCTDPQQALTLIDQETIDVLFLDIEMPEMDGFEFIENLDRSKMPSIIFTTAFDKYAVKAFEKNAVHYLLKPIDPQLLKEAVGRIKHQDEGSSSEGLFTAVKQIRDLGDRITIAEGPDYHIVSVADIVRIEGSGSYSTFYLADERKLTASKRLNHYDERLSKQVFFRSHQSHLVNLNFVQRYSKSDGGYLVMKTGHTVPLSKRNRDGLLNRLSNL